MRISVDTMGADTPPAETVLGGVRAAEKNPDVEVVLVGDADTIHKALDAVSPPSSAKVSVHHAPEVIGMDEPPGRAVRRKPQSSLVQTVELAARRETDAAVSPGNTGAVVAAALLMRMGKLEGVKRPGIAVTLSSPDKPGPSTLIDCGATLGCKPFNLFQFALMATIYQKQVFGLERPTVGVLSVGEEASKGDPLVKATSAMLAGSKLNFVGNVESREFIGHACNVVVCDGFVGNAVLKTGEVIFEAVLDTFAGAARQGVRPKLALWMLKPHLRRLKRRFDFAEYGGAPLLGVDGTVLICHGRSDSRAIMNAVAAAAQAVRHDVNGLIVKEIADLPKGMDANAEASQ